MDKLYDLKEVAQRYKVTLRSIKNWIRDEKLKAIKVTPKVYRVSEIDLIEFEKQRKD